LTIFADAVNDALDAEETVGVAPDDHWINAPLAEENDRTLLMIALEMGLKDFVQVLLQA